MSNRLMVRNNGGSNDWPSKVLHDVGGCIEGGLNRVRLRALAGFIEDLPLVRRGDEHPGPIPAINHLDGRTACIGFVLHAAGDGHGLVSYSAPAPGGTVRGYYLTGYGLICWGWGTGNGMSSVAGNGHVEALQHVLTAYPIERGTVPNLTLPDVTPAHVAKALRAFVECEDAWQAWREAAGEPAERPAPADKPIPTGARQGPNPGCGELTEAERFKQLFVADQFDEAEALCERKVADCDRRAAEIEAQVKRIAEDAATWRKRLNAVQAMR